MQEVKVRQENQTDAEAIAFVNQSAFGGDAEARLVTVVRQSKSFIPELSLVAEVGERLAGHLLLFHAYLDRQGKQQEVLALAPMSVVPSQSHRGIGSTLLQAAMTKAASLGHKAIVVIGHPDYYRRFGFENAAKWGIRSSLPVPEDSITAKELVAGALEGGGLLSYPPEFSRMFKQPGE
jgi:putative acetyltransferase